MERRTEEEEEEEKGEGGTTPLLLCWRCQYALPVSKKEGREGERKRKGDKTPRCPHAPVSEG